MNHHHTHDALRTHAYWIALGAVVLVVGGISAYAYMRVIEIDERLASLNADLSSTTVALSVAWEDLSKLRAETLGISETLTSTKDDVAAANNNISAVRNQVGGVQETVGSISGTVSTLQKLSTIDSELLTKYSKVFFLSENYRPAHLSAVPQDLVYSNSKSESFISEALPFLQQMMAAAKGSGVQMYIKSGFRSFDEQHILKSRYTVEYGAGTANAFSADQGYSEHQLGTTVDFVAAGFGGELTEAFDTTTAFQWLTQNAYKYGFILSYPKGNAYYAYEPWHWRFVGVDLATYLHNNGLRFYDIDQRVIDPYLADLFDQ